MPQEDYRLALSHRAKKVIYFMIFLMLLLILRLFFLQVLEHEEYKNQAFRQHWVKKELPAQRGAIYDRYGRLLAVSVPSFSCYADPKMVKNADSTVEKLAGLLMMDKAVILTRISTEKNRFVWLKRFLNKETADKITALKLKGIGFKKEPSRVYPHGHLASHVLGFVSAEHKGLEGIESSFDQELSGQDGWLWVLKDGLVANSKIYCPDAPGVLPKDGASVYLTLDSELQRILEDELDKVMAEHEPTGAASILLDIKTCEVLAMSSRPTFDSNNFSESPRESWRNKAVCDVFELGSVMKPLIVSAALAENLVTPETTIDCEKGVSRIIPGRRLHDSHPYGVLTVAEVIMKSSNIGTAKIGMKLGAQGICMYLENMEFHTKTSIELPGHAHGMLKPASRWTDFTLTSVPMGHEVSVTPLHMASAYVTLAGDGIYRPPSIVQKVVYPNGNILYRYQPPELKRVYPARVVHTMRSILRGVVEKGTAKKANVKGIEIAGKTGTAQKVDKEGGYSQTEYIAVFVGFAPAEEPEFCAMMMVDTPKGDVHSGGGVAAPPVSTILKHSVMHQKLARAYNK